MPGAFARACRAACLGPYEGQLVAAAFALRMHSCAICNIATASPAPNPDTMSFGAAGCRSRSLDPAVVRSIAQIDTFSAASERRASCAAALELSSRLGLSCTCSKTKGRTGKHSFSCLRAWKRERRNLPALRPIS